MYIKEVIKRRLMNRITQFIQERAFVRPGELAVFEYGMSYFMVNTANILGIIVIGLFFGKWMEMLGLLLGYMMIRPHAGGYHAKTITRCIVGTYAMYLISLWLTESLMHWPTLTVVIMMVSVLVLVFVAPVDHPNRILTKAERQQGKRRIIMRVCVLVLVVSTGLWIYPSGSRLCTSVVVGIFWASTMVLLGHMVNARKEGVHE